MGKHKGKNSYYRALGENFHQSGMPFEQEILLTFLNKGITKKQIMEETGISIGTINKILRQTHVVLRHGTFSRLLNFYIWMRLNAGEPL